MFYSDDPVADFHHYDNAKQRRLKQRPQCSECEHHIQEEELFEFDGKLICLDCLNNNHKKPTEDFMN